MTQVLYMPMDEGAGTKVADYAGGNNGAFSVNAPTWDTGKYGYGVRFNGSNNWVTTPSNDNLKFGTTDFSICAWINRDVVATYPASAFIGTGGYGQVGWSVGVAEDAYFEIALQTATGGNFYRNTSLIPAVTWTHIAATFARGATEYTVKMYINAALKRTVNYTHNGETLETANSPRIGGWGGGLDILLYDGIIDELSVFNTALTDAEVSEQFNKVPIGRLHLNRSIPQQRGVPP